MYRIEVAIILLAVLPFMMAVVFRTAVMPRRKSNMVTALKSVESSQSRTSEGSEYIRLGADRVSKEFDSQYSLRLIFPSFLLSILYLIGLSIGILLLAMQHGSSCRDLFCRELKCIAPENLHNPIAALIGSYVFNTGVLVRRAFVGDLTRNVFWGSINRIVFAVGISIAIALSPLHADVLALLISFAIAFFPSLFITWLKKLIRKALSLSDSPVEELDIQLVQGIDVWKEERLGEEGIESIQNLATADALSLAVKTNYPLRTIIDWIDQAILIQRFPSRFKQIQNAGLSISAIELCLISRHPDEALISTIAQKMEIEPTILTYSMEAMFEDAAIQHIWHLWQSRDTDE